MEEPIMSPEYQFDFEEMIDTEEYNAWLDEQELYAQEQELPEDY
jgi:hypothetical protein